MPPTVSPLMAALFQSTLPARGATKRTQTNKLQNKFQSTLPARGATRAHEQYIQRHGISIHAPCTGSDDLARGVYVQHVTFQSTLPARGATCIRRLTVDVSGRFQSTLPARGATTLRYQYLLEATFQSTLPARGATVLNWYLVKGCVFQSTLPARGATDLVTLTRRDQGISIHAPCTGSDEMIQTIFVRSRFQSTLPARGATRFAQRVLFPLVDFNPRSLHGERLLWRDSRRSGWHFNPRSLHGERLFSSISWSAADEISIHAPCTGSDESK